MSAIYLCRTLQITEGHSPCVPKEHALHLMHARTLEPAEISLLVHSYEPQEEEMTSQTRLPEDHESCECCKVSL